MVVTVGQQDNVGEKPTVILYTYVNRHAETPSNTETKDTMSLDYSSICYIGSRIGWVSMKERFKSWMDVEMEKCPVTIPTVKLIKFQFPIICPLLEFINGGKYFYNSGAKLHTVIRRYQKKRGGTRRIIRSGVVNCYLLLRSEQGSVKL